MDVTHIAEFSRLKYLHVSIDTFSSVIWATPLTGESEKYVRKHLRGCSAIMGIPQAITTDNGSAYTSHTLAEFCQQ